MSKTIVSGIQPSGNLHIGNYLGAVKQWIDLQNRGDDNLIFCVVDLHAITVPQDPKILQKKNLELAALYIACGINPEKSTIFVQSDNPDHAYLTWIFDCLTPMGWLERMTQYKDKSTKQGERTSVGLFNYPVLMATDVLLYDADEVPVGDDQTQHLELIRDLARKFNNTYGVETFKEPQIMIQKESARIMSLQDPTSKMSKSDDNTLGSIHLLDEPDVIRKKVMKAVTDSGSEITYGDDKPAIKNLLNIYSVLTGKAISNLEGMYEGKGYGEFKEDLAEAVVTELQPIQKTYSELISDTSRLQEILHNGAETARSISSKKIEAVRQAVGLAY